MKIDLSKLENVVHKSDGKIEARCPACKNEGHDTTGNHLLVYPNGKFGCVAYPKDKDHNSAILRIAGDDTRPAFPRLEIKRLVVPAVTTLLVLSRPTSVPDQKEEQTVEVEAAMEPMPVETEGAVVDTRNPTQQKPCVFSEEISGKIQAFLNR